MENLVNKTEIFLYRAPHGLSNFEMKMANLSMTCVIYGVV